MTHIMIVSANGSEAKALFYLLQRAGLGAVDLSICPASIWRAWWPKEGPV